MIWSTAPLKKSPYDSFNLSSNFLKCKANQLACCSHSLVHMAGSLQPNYRRLYRDNLYRTQRMNITKWMRKSLYEDRRV